MSFLRTLLLPFRLLRRPRRPVRVLIVDDDPGFAASLAAMLSEDRSVDVVGVAADGGDAIDLTLIHEPDVVLMDARMPVVGGVDATAHLRAIAHRARIIIMSGDSDAGAEAAAAGAVGYLPKTQVHDRVVEMIRAAGSAPG